MGSFYAFNTTVKGYLHQKKNIPCEDASESYSDENGRFQIAVVADGHGDPACMRSAAGSRRAVEITVDCLKEFAKSVTGEESGEEYESIAKQLVMGKSGKRVMQQLTNTILSRWHSFVDGDLCENPLTQEEKDQAGHYAETYRRGDRLAHAYGTTLIAALRTPDFLILIQQGDGRCDVFAGDGTVSQPIPWDDRCHENVTTSLCDEDVVTSIRSCVICFRDKKIIFYSTRLYEDGYREEPWKGGDVLACCLGSDGVEDSYRNMEGTHRFYRQLLCERTERGKEDFETYLKEWLPDFSRQGSGDDVSVGGIVDMEQAEAAAALFQGQNRQYDLEERLARYEGRQVSMSRKHEMLNRQREAARIALEEKEKQLLDTYRQIEKAKKKEQEWQEAKELCQKAEEEFAEYDREYWFVQTEMERIRQEMEGLTVTDRKEGKLDSPEEQEKTKEIKSLFGYAKKETEKEDSINWFKWRARMTQAQKDALPPGGEVMPKAARVSGDRETPGAAVSWEKEPAWEITPPEEPQIPERAAARSEPAESGEAASAPENRPSSEETTRQEETGRPGPGKRTDTGPVEKTGAEEAGGPEPTGKMDAGPAEKTESYGESAAEKADAAKSGETGEKEWEKVRKVNFRLLH